MVEKNRGWRASSYTVEWIRKKLWMSTDSFPDTGSAIAASPSPLVSQKGRKSSILEAIDRAKGISTAENIHRLNKVDIQLLQSLIENGHEIGIWETPKKWTRISTQAVVSRVDLAGRIRHFLWKRFQFNCQILDAPENLFASEMDDAILSITRYLLLLRIGPVGLGRKGSSASLDPGNIMGIAYRTMPLLAALAVQNIWRARAKTIHHGVDKKSSFKFFAFVTEDDLQLLNTSERRAVSMEIMRMRVLTERGYWIDTPRIGMMETAVAIAAPGERTYPAIRTIEPHSPLPDDYVAQMGRCCLWLIDELAPTLLQVAEGIAALWSETEFAAVSTLEVEQLRRTRLRKYLNAAVWKDNYGNLITRPPFLIRFNQLGKSVGGNAQSDMSAKMSASNLRIPSEASSDWEDRSSTWPPSSFADVMGLLATLQQAHLFVVTLSTGARSSEVLSLSRHCLHLSKNGQPYASGLTFKLVQNFEGQSKEWILPEVAMKAIKQQVTLVNLVERIGPQHAKRRALHRGNAGPAAHLWAQLPGTAKCNRSAPLTNLRNSLNRLATTLGLSTNPGGQNLKPHRLRKTVARLVALALTQAPKILMDVFGHKSIEMTLYYVLADKSLQVDVEKVCRELCVMRASDAVEHILAEQTFAKSDEPTLYGGPAEKKIKSAVSAHGRRIHQRGENWNANNVKELAEILTLQGQAWNLVREGIICTKFPGTEFGPCNGSKGQPEPSKCESTCEHRLEEGFLRQDVSSAIQESLEQYKTAEAEEDELMQSFWAGQLRANVTRFDDIRAYWLNDPTVRLLMNDG
ncbi:hypothetical protein CR152_06640 [Massilia violaceinigra]|uniref:Uncharacterized protein n=1 Tax=Massilia violaceinigra TaxID=2045208 RepID=A0A2D2DGV9_9BURK|nr:tyrosine-type recombinase/integrase [Massilia violaceinigra]ATQ74213.1 hypothetical protein CR152_06640 [Massilia violaceinigra]